MSADDRPEDRLKTLRARAQELLAELNGNRVAAQTRREGSARGESSESMIESDYLTLFLRSLSSQLNSAIDEMRATSQDLEALASELGRSEEMLDRGN